MSGLMKGSYGYDTVSIAYNCDMKGRLSLTSMLKELERAATKHLESMELDYTRLKNENMAFIVTKMHMKVIRPPRVNEELHVRTSPQFTKGAQFLRKSQLGTLDNDLLVDCQAAWVLVDPVKKSILRPKAFGYDIQFDKDEPYHEEIFTKNIELTDNAKTVFNKVVRFSDLDANKHMNNALYATVISDALPIDTIVNNDIKELYLNYQKECKYGDIIEVKLEEVEPGRYLVCGCVEGSVHFIAEVIF